MAAEIIRTAVAILALVCAAWYARSRVWHQRRDLGEDDTLLRLGIVMVLFSVAFRTVEALANDDDFGIGPVMFLGSTAVLLYGLWKTRRRGTEQ